MKYKEVKAKVLHDDADMVSYLMMCAGSDGVSINDGADIREVINSEKNWDYYDPALGNADTTYATVIGCFDENADIDELCSEINETARHAEISVGINDSADWENEWKKYYKPIDFGKLVVVPKWLDGEFGKPKALIDPGMAFGTGVHESTSMCIKLLCGLDVTHKSVVDVGCGSGILGICALALGAKDCVFIDIDPLAVTATNSNLVLNGMSATVLCGDLTEQYNEKADIVLANLTADILLKLRCDLPCITHENSYIIVSGIINARASDVLDGYLNDGKGEFELVQAIKDGEWQAFLLKRK